MIKRMIGSHSVNRIRCGETKGLQCWRASGGRRRTRNGYCETERKEKQMAKLWVYVGTSENEKDKGIYRFPFDPATGEAGPAGLAAEAAPPTLLSIPPHPPFLYPVHVG